MPRKIDDRVRNLAGETYAKTELTLAEIAKKFKVSDRTVQTWSGADHWEEQRTAHQESNSSKKVIDLASRQPSQPKQERPGRRRVEGLADGIDDLAAIEEAIAELSASLVSNDTPATALGSIATALGRLIDQKRKLKPETVEDLAELVIQRLLDWNLSARDFAIALKNRAEGNKRA
jgi:hypothetical protein